MLATAWKEQVPEGQQMLKQSSKSTISDYILYYLYYNNLTQL